MKYLISFVFLVSLSFVHGQMAKEKVPVYFGLQAKPIFPGVFIGTTTMDSNLDGFNTRLQQRVGYSFGAVVRVGLTKLIALETGINLNERKYQINSSVPDSNLYVESKLAYVTYDIPVSALFYIRLAEKFYMNVSVGAALSYNPTVVGKKIEPSSYHEFNQIALGRKVMGEALGNIGFEYRTEKSGTFYLGATARVPFGPLFYLKSRYKYQGFNITTDAETSGRVDGSFISLELKYFFPLIKSKGSPIKTPIE